MLQGTQVRPPAPTPGGEAGTQARRRQLSVAAARHASYGALACGVLIHDARGRLVYANAAAAQILGLAREDLAARPAPDPLGALLREDGAPRPAADQPALVALRTGRPQRGVTAGIILPGGERRWLQLDAAPLPGRGGAAGRVVTTFVDVTARKAAEEALAHRARHDPLTGLPNRGVLTDRLGQALREAQRQGTPLALLLLDLDHFKEVNDTLGHQYGDRLLQQAAARLQGALRASDTVARLGGDEFAVLLPRTDGDGARLVARKLLEVLAMPYPLEGHSLDVGGSVGAALYPEHGADADALLRVADVAMYQAKGLGGGYAVYSPEQDAHSPDRLSLAADLRGAIEGGQLVLHYQPLLDLERGCLHGVEALVRWRHPRRGLIPPDRFIPLAEQGGLIGVLTLWVLETGLRQCRDWERAGLRLGLAVNLSMRTLHDPQLPETVAWLLRHYQMAPERLTLEITESTLMASPLRAMAVVTQLAGLGVRLAIDDFGTGYSSLGYLKRLQVSEIKIDKSFVLGMGADAKDTAIVRSVLELGRHLDLTVVAEGVEQQATMDTLATWRCQMVQGYYLSRPLPAAELERWARASAWAGPAGAGQGPGP